MEAITEDHWQRCELCEEIPGIPPEKWMRNACGGGGADLRLAACIWLAGFGPTSPRIVPGRNEWEHCIFGKHHLGWWQSTLERVAGGGECDEECVWALRNEVSFAIPKGWRASEMETFHSLYHSARLELSRLHTAEIIAATAGLRAEHE